MKKMKASEFDKKFDAGKDVSEHLDFSRTRRLNNGSKLVNGNRLTKEKEIR